MEGHDCSECLMCEEERRKWECEKCGGEMEVLYYPPDPEGDEEPVVSRVARRRCIRCKALYY